MKLPFIYHRDFGILKYEFRRKNSCAFFTSPTIYCDCCEKNFKLYKTVGAALRKTSALSQRNNMMTVVVLVVVVMVVVVVVVVAATKYNNDVIL